MDRAEFLNQSIIVMGYYFQKSLFPLGRIMITPEVEALDIDVSCFLVRHRSGDFGISDEYSDILNQEAIESGAEVASQYPVTVGDGMGYLSIVTESDRSFTIVFLTNQALLKTSSAPDHGNQEGKS